MCAIDNDRPDSAKMRSLCCHKISPTGVGVAMIRRSRAVHEVALSIAFISKVLGDDVDLAIKAGDIGRICR
jgi:hypothetical protein